jgi:2-dehydro-3-deoxygalactonokinase
VWLAQGDQILARAQARVGVRDTARTGLSVHLRAALRALIASVIEEAKRTPASRHPSCVIAAGMITSSLGLAEIPHIPVPAGCVELAAATRRYDFLEVTELPVLLVPGVRSGPRRCDQETVGSLDLMRGEETLCAGLVALGLAEQPGIVLNLGSHWKAIQIAADGRVSASMTSLAGEMIHAAQTSTILASAVSEQRPAALDHQWVKAGMREQRRSGLARALFCVRLLEQASDTTPAERLAFLIGAFLASDLDALIQNGIMTQHTPVAITGSSVLAEAWQRALAEAAVPAVALKEDDTERALLAGLRSILNRNMLA